MSRVFTLHVDGAIIGAFSVRTKARDARDLVRTTDVVPRRYTIERLEVDDIEARLAAGEGQFTVSYANLESANNPRAVEIPVGQPFEEGAYTYDSTSNDYSVSIWATSSEAAIVVAEGHRLAFSSAISAL